jgi:hypothetical protein
MRKIHPQLANDLIIERCHSLLEEMEDMLVAVEPMSPAEVRRAAKVPRGREPVVAHIARLCAAMGLTHLSEGPALAEAKADLEEAHALRTLRDRHDRARDRLDAWRLSAETRGWGAILAFYATLRRLARRNAALAEALAPAKAFFGPSSKAPRLPLQPGAERRDS